MNRREGFDAMNAIVLRKRDLNYKLKLVPNEDWEKRFKFFWALVWEKTTFVVRFSLLMTTFQSVFWSSLYFLLTLLFARYSPLYVSLFLFSFAFPSPHFAYFSFLSNFLARFSRLALRLLFLLLWFLCLFLSSLFSLKTLSPRTWIITVFSGWESFSSAGIVALRVD